MLNRSRSWPVQSVVTLDPRGIVCSKIRGPIDARTPDVVLEASERPWTGPDIFPAKDGTRALPAEISVIEEDSKLLTRYQIDLLRKKTEAGCEPQRKPAPADRSLVRSHSLGHEQIEAKANRTFKKYSLPTPRLKDANPDGETAKRKTVSEVKKVSTLTRHYYPEGGWGFVILTCSVLVQVLCHGLQLSSGTIMVKSAGKFDVDVVHTVCGRYADYYSDSIPKHDYLEIPPYSYSRSSGNDVTPPRSYSPDT
ncbi:UNVERIFIED_CONTAM: hypothetical protein PYX00_003376 [Menopon gallinae]|uniref:Uncharacterized protein n=1 Tax=Menopon gallinae TaxID=328185 RepID=A0AAW2I0G7_9NEOP